MSSHIKTLINLLESLPLDIQKKAVEHLRQYIEQLEKDLYPQAKPQTIPKPENYQIIANTNETFADLSPEEIEMLNNCIEYPVWTPYDSFL